jgi:flagellar FliL protein
MAANANTLADGAAAPGPASEAASVKTGAAGFKPWLPLVLNLALMPVLAYAMTTFVLLPKVNGSRAAEAPASGGHGGASTEASAPHGKVTAALSNKVLVNVAGTKGTRYLLANVTLVGARAGLPGMVEKHDAQLRDVTASVLASKTIDDLGQPGARNQIRTELIAAFTSVLGDGWVTELYLTDFAIQ